MFTFTFVTDTDGGSHYKISAREKIESLLKQHSSVNNEDWIAGGEIESSHKNKSKILDTVVYPLVQMGPFGIRYDEAAMIDLMRLSDPSDHILFATGYFNLTDQYSSSILDEAKAKFNILMASPKVHTRFNGTFLVFLFLFNIWPLLRCILYSTLHVIFLSTLHLHPQLFLFALYIL